MKKFILFLMVGVLLTAFLVPHSAMGAGLVPCGNEDQKPCQLSDIFVLIAGVFDFIVKFIATPLATLMILIGGILMLISGGNPGLASQGKDMIKWSIIAIILIWGSYLIIDTVLKAIGFSGANSWFNSPF